MSYLDFTFVTLFYFKFKKMGKTKSIVVLAITACTLSGCLQMFPPTVAELNSGVYQLHAQSNAFGSREALRAKLIGKAKENM